MMRSPDRLRPSTLVAYMAVMTALAEVCGYLEQLIPINLIGIPGVKPGLANIVSLIALYVLGPGYAFFIMIARILLTGFMFGNMYAVIYSLAGGILSMTVMCFLKASDRFTITGVSAAGGAAHNTGQLIVASLTLNELNLSFYFPLLLIAGVICGILTGVIGRMVTDRLCPDQRSMEDSHDRILKRNDRGDI